MSRILQDGLPIDLAASLRRVGRGRRLVGMLALWGLRHRTRTQLSALDPHMLADIGLTEAQARKEVRRPFWLA